MRRSYSILWLLAVSYPFTQLVQADTIARSDSYGECLVLGMKNQIKEMFPHVSEACADKHPKLKAFVNPKHVGTIFCSDDRIDNKVQITARTIFGYDIVERNELKIVGVAHERTNFADHPSLQPLPPDLRRGVKVELNISAGVISFSSTRNRELVERYQCREQ